MHREAEKQGDTFQNKVTHYKNMSIWTKDNVD